MRVERGMEKGGRAVANCSTAFRRKSLKHFVRATLFPFPKFLTD